MTLTDYVLRMGIINVPYTWGFGVCGIAMARYPMLHVTHNTYI